MELLLAVLLLLTIPGLLTYLLPGSAEPLGTDS